MTGVSACLCDGGGIHTVTPRTCPSKALVSLRRTCPFDGGGHYVPKGHLPVSLAGGTVSLFLFGGGTHTMSPKTIPVAEATQCHLPGERSHQHPPPTLLFPLFRQLLLRQHIRRTLPPPATPEPPPGPSPGAPCWVPGPPWPPLPRCRPHLPYYRAADAEAQQAESESEIGMGRSQGGGVPRAGRGGTPTLCPPLTVLLCPHHPPGCRKGPPGAAALAGAQLGH